MQTSRPSLDTSIPTLSASDMANLFFPVLQDEGFEPLQLFGIEELNRRDDPCSPASRASEHQTRTH